MSTKAKYMKLEVFRLFISASLSGRRERRNDFTKSDCLDGFYHLGVVASFVDGEPAYETGDPRKDGRQWLYARQRGPLTLHAKACQDTC